MRDKNTGIKVFIPCSISGFSVGKTCISVASSLPGDEIIARFDQRHNGVLAKNITGYKSGLSADSSHNSAVLAANMFCTYLNTNEGIVLDIHKKIPLGVGLSSCAASAVGGVFAVNELLGRPLERYDLADFAIQAVRKFIPSTDDSQVLSILYGGAILSRNTTSEPFQKLYLPKGLFLSIFYQEHVEYHTPDFPSWLNHFSNETLLKYAQNMGGFISALYTSNLDLMKDCFSLNELDQSLGTSIPCYSEIKSEVEAHGVIGLGIAGLGPAFFVLSPNSLIAEKSTQLIEKCFREKRIPFRGFQTKIDMNGVSVC